MLDFHLIEEAQQRAEVAEKERLEKEKHLAQEKSSVAKEVKNFPLIFSILGNYIPLDKRIATSRIERILWVYSTSPTGSNCNSRETTRGIQSKRSHRQKPLEPFFASFQWKRVMQCDGTPDPTVLPEINTFISLWHDDKQRTDIEYIMKQTNLVLSLIRELTNVSNSIPTGSSELQNIPNYKKVRLSISNRQFSPISSSSCPDDRWTRRYIEIKMASSNAQYHAQSNWFTGFRDE